MALLTPGSRSLTDGRTRVGNILMEHCLPFLCLLLISTSL